MAKNRKKRLKGGEEKSVERIGRSAERRAVKSPAVKGPRAPEVITGVWTALMLSLFPLIYTDFYFNILETKFVTFCLLTAAMAVPLFLWALPGGRLLKGLARPGFSMQDRCMLVFFFCSLAATLLAFPYVRQAVTGEEGRYTGMFYVALLTAAYFCMRFGFRFRRGYLILFLCTAWIVCGLGITDFFNLNLLHFRDYMKEEQYAIFCSTIGNINTYTVFVGFVIALSGTLFILSEEGFLRRCFYFATLLVSFAALLMGSSDNGYLTLAAFFAFLPLVAFRRRRSAIRYAAAAAAFVSALLYVSHVSRTRAGEVLHIDGLFQLLSGLRILPAAAALLWGAVLLFVFLEKRRERRAAGGGDAAPPMLLRLWIGALILSALGLIVLFVQANGMSYEEALRRYGSMAGYLKFRDGWGTQRGYVWRAAVEEYLRLPLLKRLTGTGPDTFGVYMIINRWKDMQEVTGQIYDSAHNEYLQYLFTIGPLGLASYLGVLFFAVRSVFQKGKRLLSGGDGARENGAYFYAIGYLIICYAAQAAVNINLPISAPVMWVFVMMAAATGRQAEKEKKENREKKAARENVKAAEN